LDEYRTRLETAKLAIEQRQEALAGTNANIDRLKEIIPLSEERATSYQQLWQKTYVAKLQYLDAFDKVRVDQRIGTPASFCSDPHRIRAILVNILSNAIIFSDPKKESSVKISVVTTERSATISISDNGIGICQEYLPRVSNMFFRASELSKGAGLGLYITREIIRKLNGTITISSDEGVGTEVNVSIPNRNHFIGRGEVEGKIGKVA